MLVRRDRFRSIIDRYCAVMKTNRDVIILIAIFKGMFFCHVNGDVILLRIARDQFHEEHLESGSGDEASSSTEA